MSRYRLINAECEDVLTSLKPAVMGFWDPPDNIGLAYRLYKDKTKHKAYLNWMSKVTWQLMRQTQVFWVSFNVKYTLDFGELFNQIIDRWNRVAVGAQGFEPWLPVKPCVQTFTFGQHNHHDLGNNHRPLWRFTRKDATLYPDQIRVPSWRQLHGDKRADPRGRVPGDVFDFTRVTGNSAQRRKWCPTQLHEDLVTRCILLCTKEGDRVIDPCGGSGTTLRVCRRLKRNCTTIEYDRTYCTKIAKENGLHKHTPDTKLQYQEWRL
jgi:hypothetical protein